MRRLAFILLCLLIFIPTVFSQDSLSTTALVGVRGMWQTGNFAQLMINPNVTYSLENSKNHFELNSNYELLRVKGHNLIDDFWVSALFQKNVHKRLYPMIIAQYGFAESFAIDESYTAGAGAGFNIIKKTANKYFQAIFYGGFLHFKYEGTQIHKAPNTGYLLRLKKSLVRNKVNLLYNMHAFISIKDEHFRGFINRIILQFIAGKNFGMDVSYRLVYNSNAPDRIKEYNGKLVFGLNYKFHK